MMKELACISVILFGLAAGKGQTTPSYVPTVATAAAAVAATPVVDIQLDLGKPLASCLNGKCGLRRTQAAIKAGATKVRTTRRRLVRFRRFRRR